MFKMWTFNLYKDQKIPRKRLIYSIMFNHSVLHVAVYWLVLIG